MSTKIAGRLGRLDDDFDVVKGCDIAGAERRDTDAKRADVAARMRHFEVGVGERGCLRGQQNRDQHGALQQSGEPTTHRAIVSE